MWDNHQYKTVTIAYSLLDTVGRENQKNPTEKVLQRINNDPVI